jgi:hypothetical protein
MPMLRITAGAAALALLSVAPLAAQHAQEAEDAQLRAHCHLAAQALETGHPHPHYDWAIDQIRRCDQSAGPALARRWTSLRDADRTELDRLAFSSMSLRDQRIFDAAVGVASSREAAPLVRLAALRVLTSYAKRSVDVPLRRLEQPKDDEALPRVVDFAPTVGAVPPRPDNPDVLISLLRQLVQQEADPQVAAAARYLLRGFGGSSS